MFQTRISAHLAPWICCTQPLYYSDIYFFSYGGQLVEHTPHVKLFVFLSHALCSVECQPDFTVNLHLQLQAKLQVPSI